MIGFRQHLTEASGKVLTLKPSPARHFAIEISPFPTVMCKGVDGERHDMFGYD
jgi:hypothetical protein